MAVYGLSGVEERRKKKEEGDGLCHYEVPESLSRGSFCKLVGFSDDSVFAISAGAFRFLGVVLILIRCRGFFFAFAFTWVWLGIELDGWFLALL